MTSKIGNNYKYNLAKELFRDSVLPFLSDTTDEYCLRLLRNGCDGNSKTELCLSKAELSNLILSLNNFDNCTPLFATIKDSIRYIKNQSKQYDEIQLFVLTDGEDNCSNQLTNIFEKDYLKKLNINLDMLLVQFGVESTIQSNNLTAFSNLIGATTIQVKTDDLKNYELAKTNFRKDLSKTKLNTNYQLSHCFEADLNQKILSWQDIDHLGFPRFWATILFEEKFIDWNPILRGSIYEYEFKEFSFLASIRFRSNMSREILNNLLAQLSKPYYYCLEEIYWDFKTSCWKYFELITQSEIIDNPERFNENKDFDTYRNDKGIYITNNPVVNEGSCYEVVKEYQNIGFNYALRQTDWQTDKMKTIHEGDFLIFKEKSIAGRPKKHN